jgi:hypothetical protein
VKLTPRGRQPQKIAIGTGDTASPSTVAAFVSAPFLAAGKPDTLWRIGNARQRRAMMGGMSLAPNPPSGAPRRTEADGSHD